jgi:hypothetical protein
MGTIDSSRESARRKSMRRRESHRHSSKIALMILLGMLSLDADDGGDGETSRQ